MEGSDPFDVGAVERENPFSASTTLCGSRFGSKLRGRRTYGRRGSEHVDVKNRTAQRNNDAFRQSRSSSLWSSRRGIHHTPTEWKDEDDFSDGKELEALSPITPPGPTAFVREDSIATPPTRRKKLARASTVTGASPLFQGPNRPPPLTRSRSVSALMSGQNAFRSSGSFLSGASSSSSLTLGDNENCHPNYGNPSIKEQEDDTSPKRSAAPEADPKGRKKKKSFSTTFLQNDFSALNGGTEGGKHPLPPCAPNSFSGLARNHGKVGSTWASSSDGVLPSAYSSTMDASYRKRRTSSGDLFSLSSFSYHDDFMDGSDSISSPSMASSTRKRGASKPQHLYDDSPVQRFRYRISSPPNRTPLMDVSFNSIKKGKNPDRAMPDVFMSDDEINVSRDSDISVESEDEGMSTDFSNDYVAKCPLSTKSVKIFEPKKATTEDIMKRMPFFKDIQYLTKSLQQNAEGLGGCRCWHVAPPVKWPAKRRDKFFQATGRLGFKFQSGGMGISVIQISKTRGSELLELLKKTLETYDELKVKERTSNSKVTNVPIAFDFSSTVKKQLTTGKGASKMLQLTPKELTPSSWCQRSKDKATDELAEIMGNLDMNANRATAVKEIDETTLDANLGENRSGCGIQRKSLEYHSSSSDLNAQMHGTTPVPSRFRGRPPRLSLQSVSSRATIISSSMDIQSPFVTSYKPTQINTNMSCGMNADVYSEDLVYTPLVGRNNDWGSRPFDGRDWGNSDVCGAITIKKLSHRFVRCRKLAGFEDESSDDVLSCDEFESSPCLGLDFDAAAQYSDDIDILTVSSPSDDTGVDKSPSFGATVFFSDIDRTNGVFEDRAMRRRQTTFAKHKRMSLFASAVNTTETFSKHRKSLFIRQPVGFTQTNNNLLLDKAPEFYSGEVSILNESIQEPVVCDKAKPLENDKILRVVFDFLEEDELYFIASVVSKQWSEVATHSHAAMMMATVAVDDDEDEAIEQFSARQCSHGSWEYLMSTFPWACFLSEGAFKRVYKVFNRSCRQEEAISVMDVDQIHSTGNLDVVRMELAVSVMLSSLVRFGVCPNFISTRRMFASQFEPPDNQWGTSDNKRPKGSVYCSPKTKRVPREPKQTGNFQYIRMELCDEGDAEEFLKRQQAECIDPVQARNILFQIAFALYAAAEKFSLKHYDVKLLNIFLKRMPQESTGNVVLRYGLGEHTFALQTSREDAIIAKLADYGTANVDCVTNGQNVTIAQFTTLENTPPDFLILGDDALQGHGHDCFGLGLCMLHLFTGHAPYEEILEEVKCPINLKKELRRIWENDDEVQYSVVRSIVLDDVYRDEDGNIIEGEADETLYDTLYKFLVLFGIPDTSSGILNSKVMAAVNATLVSESRQKKVRGRARKLPCDAKEFENDRRKFSLSYGTNKFISRARASLSAMDGGMELLMSLVQFNPQRRATALDVLNSSFMAPLRESPGEVQCYSEGDEVFSFTAFSTQTKQLRSV